MKILNNEEIYDQLDIEAFMDYHCIDDMDEKQVIWDMFDKIDYDCYKLKKKIFN